MNGLIDKLAYTVDKMKLSVYDALLMVIEEYDLEPSEVVKVLPPSIVAQLRQIAIAENKLRPSMIDNFNKTFCVDDFFQ